LTETLVELKAAQAALAALGEPVAIVGSFTATTMLHYLFKYMCKADGSEALDAAGVYALETCWRLHVGTTAHCLSTQAAVHQRRWSTTRSGGAICLAR